MLRVVVHSGITPRCGLLKTHVSSFFSYTKVPSAPCGRAFSTVSISSPSMLVLCCPRLHRPPQLTSVVATLQGGRRCAASFGRDGKVRRNAPIQSTDYDEKDDEDTYYSSVSSSVHEISADRAQTGKEAALLVDNDERRNATKKVVDNKICTGGSNASTSSFKSLRVPAHVYTNLHHVRVHHPTKLQKMVIPHLIRWYDKERGTAYMPPTVGIQGHTGSGKTLSYLLPILSNVDNFDRSGVQAIIIVPSRELATQIAHVATQVSRLGHGGKRRKANPVVIKAFVGKVNPMMIADLQSTNAPPPTAPTPNGATFSLVEEATTPSYGEEIKGSRTYENYDDEATGEEEESAGEDATSEYSAFNHRFQKRSLSRTSKVQRREKSAEDRTGFRDEVSDFKRMEKKWTMPKGQPHIAIGTPDVIYDLLQKGHLQVSTHHGVSYDDAVTALDVNNVHLDLLQSVQFSSMSGVSTESAMSLSTSSRILKYLVFDEIDHIMNKSAGKETASLTKLLGMPAEQAVFVSASLSKDQAIHYSRLSKRSDMPLDPPHNFESLSSMLPAMEMSFDLGAAKQSVLFLSQIDLEMRLAAAADTTGTSTSSPPRMPIGTRHYFLKVPSGINKYDVLLDVLCQFKLKAKVAKAKDAAQRVGRHQIKSIDSVPLYSLSAKRNPLNICPGAVLAFFSRAFPISHFGLPHILRNGGLSAWALTDSASRQDRKNALGSDKLVDVIFSTDVLARGLDLPNLSLVVNADVPISTTTYLHRGGRVGRVGAIYRKQSAVLTIVQDVRDTRESEGTAKILDAADIQKGSDEGGELSEGDVGDDPTTRVSRDIDGNDVRNAPHHSKGPSSLSFGDMALLEAHAKKLGVKMTPWPWTVHFGSHKSILQDSAKYLTLGSQQKRRVTPPRGIPHSDRTKNPVAQEPSPRRSSSGSSESARESSPKERKAIVDSKNRERYGTFGPYDAKKGPGNKSKKATVTGRRGQAMRNKDRKR